MTDDEARQTIEAHLDESRKFAPPEPFARHANVADPKVWERADADYKAFWADWAAKLDWDEPWNEVLNDSKAPFYKWFTGGKINASRNCLDRHVEAGRGDKVALHWEGEPGDRRTLTYAQLKDEVCRFASALRELGVAKGDRVTMYLPMIPELMVAMLACARIGAAHNVVFGGFSPHSVADRMDDCGSRVLITCDAYHRGGKLIQQKSRADEAVQAATIDVEHVIVVDRTGEGQASATMTEGRDHWWGELVAGRDATCEPESMDAEDMLFLMYTSGTTGKPKGILHTTGGYLTGTYATSQCIFDYKDDDVYWCMADIGWITGHSYIVYGPLLNGVTQVMYEGAPSVPDHGRPWDIIERYGVTILYTAPTAIRSFMKNGAAYPERHDLGSLRLLGTVGEPINPAAWMWYHETIGGTRCPIVDTWWQTETGMILLTPLPGLTTTVPGSATKPFPGVEAKILDADGQEVPPGQGGFLAVTRPWPAMLRTLYGDDDRYVATYWSKWDKTTYFAGDGARVDADGNFWIMGRVDDVLNVSGHRLSTMEIESALVGHAQVAEAAVTGARDDMTGQTPVAFVILEAGIEGDDAAKRSLLGHVVEAIGPIAKPRDIVFVDDLPKTRSGKIMRRLLKDIVEGRALGDTTTLAEPAVAQQVEARYRELRALKATSG